MSFLKKALFEKYERKKAHVCWGEEERREVIEGNIVSSDECLVFSNVLFLYLFCYLKCKREKVDETVGEVVCVS